MQEQPNIDPRWFIAQIKPGEADRAIIGLERKAVLASYPQYKTRDGVAPVLPGYMFIWVEPTTEEFAKVTTTAGIEKLLPISHKPSAVPILYMDDFFKRLGAGVFDEVVEPLHKPLPWFNKSETIGIASGPFAGHTAIFKHVRKGSVVCEVKFFGQLLEVELKGHQVSKLS